MDTRLINMHTKGYFMWPVAKLHLCMQVVLNPKRSLTKARYQICVTFKGSYKQTVKKRQQIGIWHQDLWAANSSNKKKTPSQYSNKEKNTDFYIILLHF